MNANKWEEGAKRLWEVKVTFTVPGHDWNNAPICVVARTEQEARDFAPDAVHGIWLNAKIVKVGEARPLPMGDK